MLPAFALAVALAFALTVEFAPLLVFERLRGARDPTGDERDRLDGLARPDYPVRVLPTEGETLTVAVRGPPGARRLYVAEHALDALDGATLEALFAGEAGRARVAYVEYRALTVALVAGASVAVFGGAVPFGSGFAAVGLSALLAFAGGRRLQYRADALAARDVGPDALADAFEAVARRRGVDPEAEAGSWRTLFEVQPPLGDRIARLRDGAGNPVD